KKKKAKEEAAALQKLEKAIKRDLGARTSFSKYAVSARLQDGLFGVCKAYALFDEGVGYAQGMNFLAMPLLFNVSFYYNDAHLLLIMRLDARRRSILHACPAHEPIQTAGNVHSGHARSTPSSLPV